MTIRLLIFLLLLPWFAVDGDEEGRRGNEFYGQQQYALAIEAYDRGLAALSEEAPRLLRYGLLNNLGAALLKSGDAEAAGEAFTRALNAAPGPVDVARTSYNAGNASFAAQDLESALQRYRESLLADPANEDAKFNYEFVKRQLQQQQEQEQQQQQGDQQNDEEQEQQDQQQGDQEQEEGEQNPQQQDEQQDGGSQQEQEESPSEQEQEQEQQSQQQPSPNELSEEQAEQILQALQNEEEQLLRQVQRPKSRPRHVEKDW